MNDNVILLGAGASVDAGIPLMSNFVETMLRMARLKRWSAGNFTPEDQEVLDKAVEIRNLLDGFLVRAEIDVWNIEELLSVLMFHDEELVPPMAKAIARVVDLSCRLKPAWSDENQWGNVLRYYNFWSRLIKWATQFSRPTPTILTFNYDLVLEISLIHLLKMRDSGALEALRKYSGIHIAYQTSACPDVFLKFEWAPNSRSGRSDLLNLLKVDERLPDMLQVTILKLHGSLNFQRTEASNEKPKHLSFLFPQPDPLILPPVFSKSTTSLGSIWDTAKDALGHCSNLVVCGYSLPTTDTYMQYFLRAAIGANTQLNRIFVFDPAFRDSDRAEYALELRKRYSDIFSAQMRGRIDFGPVLYGFSGSRGVKPENDRLPDLGTFNDLVAVMGGMSPEIPFA